MFLKVGASEIEALRCITISAVVYASVIHADVNTSGTTAQRTLTTWS